ncbi:MAG TPA: tRNA (guanosine(37)-N1)-methyltransferase TrmD [Methylomirabilota bacterium]|nr:tRNA (guanosine(37)-N1)-methyltransferase TrmD [Methylomirabilota bacterium]
MTRIDVVTLFPAMLSAVLAESMLRVARERGAVDVRVVDLRDFTEGRHRVADDYPFGGGGGMVLKPEPLFAAVEALRGPESRVVLLCPQGSTFTQSAAERLAKEAHLVLLCGHYEGVDERVRTELVDEELSIGDYVLTGGELPAMVVLDAVVRLLPGVLGDPDGAARESFAAGRLDYPQYTRPAEFRGLPVPEVLLSGDHGRIARWRRREAFRRTLARRPDLLRSVPLTREEGEWMDEMTRSGELTRTDE